MRKTVLVILLSLIVFVVNAETTSSTSLRLAISTPSMMTLKFSSPIEKTITLGGTHVYTYSDLEDLPNVILLEFDVTSFEAAKLTVRHPTSKVVYTQTIGSGYTHVRLFVPVSSNPMVYLIFTRLE